jgi:PAS domain S-box-containing protein
MQDRLITAPDPSSPMSLAASVAGLVRRHAAMTLAVGLWLYAAVLGVHVAINAMTSTTPPFIAPGWLLPAQLVAAALVVARLRRGDLTGMAKLGWRLVLASILNDALATTVLTELARLNPTTYGSWDDFLYIANYAFTTGAAAALFRSLGGNFRERRIYADAATIALAIVAASLPFLVQPMLQHDTAHAIEFGTTTGYLLGIVVSATMLALLLMQLSTTARNIPVLLIFLALMIGVAVDIFSTGEYLQGRRPLHGLDNLAYILVQVLLATAAALRSAPQAPRTEDPASHSPRVGFAPILALLVSVLVLLGAQLQHGGPDLVVPAALTALGAGVLLTREISVRGEVHRLHRKLALRDAEERVTELVRRSSDMIVIIAPSGTVTYISPACETLLGTPSHTLIDTPATLLLGPDSALAMALFLAPLLARQASQAETEISVQKPDGVIATLHLIGADQDRNPLIAGTVLTIRDVTEQRTLEREVLAVANHERQRLSGELHDGLGQELTGVSLLLRSVINDPTQDPQQLRRAVEPILGYVNDAIQTTRVLAHGLSPLLVVKGSLPAALQQLSVSTSSRSGVAVTFNDLSKNASLDATAAEHLYRIAQESISNALRHSGCASITMTLAADPTAISLTIVDDGRGIDGALESVGLGIRMMGYRARLVGGTARVERAEGAGTRVVVNIARGTPT